MLELNGSEKGDTPPGDGDLGSKAAQNSPTAPTCYVLSLAQNILSTMILAGGLLTIPAAAYLSIVSYTGVPFWDEWTFIASLATSSRPYSLTWFLAQNNEHRNLLYRLLLLTDVQFFDGRQVLLYVSMFALQLGFLMAMAWMLRSVGELRGALWRTTVGLAAFCFFCPSQWENLCWPLQVSFFAPGCFALLAFLSVILSQRAGRNPLSRWVIAILGLVLASVATYSNANGMLIWPLLLGIAFMLRVPLKMIGVYAAIGLTMSALYFYGYKSPPNLAHPVQSLRHVSAVAEYVAKYFGGSFPWQNLNYAVPIGWEALFVALALVIWAIARRQLMRPLPLVLVGLMLFCLTTAIITALGRINFGTNQAFAPRYQTWALLFWFCLASMLLLALVNAGARVSITCLMAGIVVLMIIAAENFGTPLQKARTRRTRQTIVSLALMTQVPDYGIIADTYVDPEIPWKGARYLKERHLSIFSTDQYRELNGPLAPRYHILAQDACRGYVDKVGLVPDQRSDSAGLKIAGWTVDARTQKPVQKIIAVVDGTIVGFGGVGIERSDVAAALHSPQALLSGWVGFARVPASAKDLEVYGQVDPSGGICKVADVPVPTH
jgi:hypothetical protein